MGRRKIRIERIKETRTRNVTFHKRKLGIMKKAYEISILCGAEVAFIALYEGKASMYCSGDLDTVIAKFAHHRQFKPVDVRYSKEFAAMCAKAKRGDDDDDEDGDDGTAEDDSHEAGTTSPMQSQVTLVNPEPPFSLAPHLTQQAQYPPPVPQSIPNGNGQVSMIKNEPVSFYTQPSQQQQQQQPHALPPHLHYAQQHVGPASHSLHNSPMMRPMSAPGPHSYPGSAHGSPMTVPVSLSVQSTGNGQVMMLSQAMPQQQQQQFAPSNSYQQQQHPFAFAPQPQQPLQQTMAHHAPSPDPTPNLTPVMHNGSPMARPVSSALAAAMPALQGHRRFSAPTSAPPTPPMQAVPLHNTGSQSPMSTASSSRLSNTSARLPPLRIDIPLEERTPVVNGVVMAQPPRAGPLTALLQGELPDPSSVMNGGGNGSSANMGAPGQQQPAVFTPSIFSPNTAALFRSLSNA